MKQLLILLILFFMTNSCTYQGEVPENQPNKTMRCVDFRDGEVFYFDTKTMVNARIGIFAPSTVEVTTYSGKKKILSSDAEVWMKCEPYNQANSADS